MPIEIKELVIKATISSDKKTAISGGNRKLAGSDEDNKNAQKIMNEILSRIKNREER